MEHRKQMKNGFAVLALALCFGSLQAQEAKKDIRMGNKQLEKGMAPEAEVSYRKALQRDPNTTVGIFNLGNSLYRQEKFEESGEGYKKAAESFKPGVERSRAYHNMGNSLVQQKKLEEAINSFKQALRENPSDMETKYNLAYAQRLLKKQQEQDKKDQNQQNQQNQDQKDKEQDNNKPGTKNQEQKNQEQKNQEQKNQEQSPPPPPSGAKSASITPEDAQRLLEALQGDEKDIQEKVQQTMKSETRQVDKNW